MTTITDIITNVISKSIQSVPVATVPRQKKKVAIVLDVSGSTGGLYSPLLQVTSASTTILNKEIEILKTILNKEIEVLKELILSKPDSDFVLYTFDSAPKYLGPIQVMHSEGLVDIPALVPGSATNTHLPLVEIIKKFPVFKPSSVILFTDGQTHSSSYDFKTITQAFNDAKVNFEVIAVTNSVDDLEKITTHEESRIPGMDLITMIGNSIQSLKIYNRFHSNQPFNGAQSSAVNRNALTFIGIPFSGIIPQFISNLLAEIKLVKDTINWGENDIHLKKMICEIGKLLSVLFVSFPEDHSFTHDIIEIVASSTTFVHERIQNIMKYGFDCTRNNKPIIYTNFEGRVKDSVVKQNEFAEAVTQLNTRGTTLGSSSSICFPTNGVSVINNNAITLNRHLGPYPNSMDTYSNVYFGLDMDPQAIRIAIREFCGTVGFYNAKMSPSVIFYTCNQMALMYINGIPMNCEHMNELRKLAIIQVSMETMVAAKKYDGVGCYLQWKAGNLIKMNYQNPATHASLYKDRLINPLNLSEPLWWALMMSMLGIYKEQLHVYETAVSAILNGVTTEEAFLNYIRTEYESKVVGNVILQKYSQPKWSVITLDAFNPADNIFMVKDHNQCKAQTWYSENEMNSYVKIHGCVWCHFVPTDAHIEKITLEVPDILLADAMKNGKACTIQGMIVPTMATAIQPTQPSRPNNHPSRPTCRSRQSKPIDPNVKFSRKVCINMQGITGSGKSTAAQLMYDQIVKSGKLVKIISADKWSKAGLSGGKLAEKVYNEIRNFNSQPGDKVIIIDICNERGIQSKCFKFDLSDYETFTFVPNFDINRDDFNDYESWCLQNVLSRPMHDDTCNYWLNPVSAGVETCIAVHNAKAQGIRNCLSIRTTQLNFDENMDIDQIMSKIKDGAARHLTRLNASDQSQLIATYLSSCNL